MMGATTRHQTLFLFMGLLLSLRSDDTRASESSSNPQHNLPDITTFAFRSSSSSQSNPNQYPSFNNQNDNDSDRAEDEEKGEYQSTKNSGEGENPSSSSSSSQDEQEESAVFSSSLLFDGGCVVSTEAIMCSGGDMNNNNNHNGFAGSSSTVMDYFDYYYDNDDDEEESDDDDDDDDDNDGHSSMLSNASLRRSKVGAGGYHSHRYESSSSSSAQQQEQNANRKQKGDDIVARSSPPHGSNNYYLKQIQRGRRQQQQQQQRRPSASVAFFSTPAKALSVRGGGVAAATGTEFAQKLLVTALVTLVFEFMIGHSLEFVKISMQTSKDGTSYGSVLQKITAEKGIGGLWDGFCPWGVIQSIFKGSVFGLAHAIATSVFLPLAESGTIPMQLALTVAGGIGGGFQGFVLSPTLLLKTRVMTNPVFREKMSLWRTTVLSAKIGSDVVAAEGIAALMKGSGVFSTKRVCDWASRYYFSDLFESLAIKNKGGASLSVGEKMACSLLGGTASTIVTLPLDVLVAKIQDAKKAGVSCSAWKLFQDELSQKGWNGLKNSYMKGFEARLLHVALTTVAIKTGTPIAYDLLFPAQEATSSS